jgi:hypothetical protein
MQIKITIRYGKQQYYFVLLIKCKFSSCQTISVRSLLANDELSQMKVREVSGKATKLQNLAFNITMKLLK